MHRPFVAATGKRRAARVTAIELDDDLYTRLAERLAGTDVDVVHGNAAHTDFPDDRFSAAACFGVLHHIPSAEEQGDVLREISRVLRPGGWLLATDAHADHEGTRERHRDDIFVPLPVATLPDRLHAAGFADISIDGGSYEIRFTARKPT